MAARIRFAKSRSVAFIFCRSAVGELLSRSLLFVLVLSGAGCCALSCLEMGPAISAVPSTAAALTKVKPFILLDVRRITLLYKRRNWIRFTRPDQKTLGHLAKG